MLTTKMNTPQQPELACSQAILPCDFCRHNMCIARIVTHKNLDPHPFWCAVSPALFVHVSQILRPRQWIWYKPSPSDKWPNMSCCGCSVVRILHTKCYHTLISCLIWYDFEQQVLLVFDLLCKWLLGFRWPSCKWFLSTPGGSWLAAQIPQLPFFPWEKFKPLRLNRRIPTMRDTGKGIKIIFT